MGFVPPIAIAAGVVPIVKIVTNPVISTPTRLLVRLMGFVRQLVVLAGSEMIAINVTNPAIPTPTRSLPQLMATVPLSVLMVGLGMIAINVILHSIHVQVHMNPLSRKMALATADARLVALDQIVWIVTQSIMTVHHHYKLCKM